MHVDHLIDMLLRWPGGIDCKNADFDSFVFTLQYTHACTSKHIAALIHFILKRVLKFRQEEDRALAWPKLWVLPASKEFKNELQPIPVRHGFEEVLSLCLVCFSSP